jgi:transposase
MAHVLDEVIVGVDTHLDVYVGAVINSSGNVLGTRSISDTNPGYQDRLKWAISLGNLQCVGIDGTGTYGAAVYRYLANKRIAVIAVHRPDRSVRRLQGKADPLDAENAARSVLAGTSTAIPKLQNGASEAIRMITVARRNAVKAKTQAMHQIRTLLVSAP